MKPLIFVLGLALGNLLLLLVPGQTINLNKESAEKALVQHRQRIDVLDKQIISLLNERARIALDIGRIRKRESIPSSALGRQQEVLRNVMSNSVAPLSPQAARRIYERIIGEMVVIQTLDRSDEGAGRRELGRER
jgi:chorismate mutase